MVESTFLFGETQILRAGPTAERSPQALLLFPGFPGYAPAPGAFHGPPKMRVELAKAVLPLGGLDAFLPGYEGLAIPGKFRFERAVRAGVEFSLALAAQGYERVHVGGHSFGAFVAFNAHRALGAKAGKLALISGLLDLPDERAVRDFLPYYLDHFPQVLGAGPGAFERCVADLEGARRSGNPLSAAGRMGARDLLLIHGLRDAEISFEQSRRFHARAGGRLLLTDGDHGHTGGLGRLGDELRRFLAPHRNGRRDAS